MGDFCNEYTHRFEIVEQFWAGSEVMEDVLKTEAARDETEKKEEVMEEESSDESSDSSDDNQIEEEDESIKTLRAAVRFLIGLLLFFYLLGLLFSAVPEQILDGDLFCLQTRLRSLFAKFACYYSHASVSMLVS